MDKRILGRDLQVSSIGLGCMGMSHAYGAPADKKEMTELLAKAVDIGYTFFDTAEVYGTPEHPHNNEELVGKALKPYRNHVVLATKFGIHFDMERLQTDHIDLYYQHRPDPQIPVEEVAGVMSELIAEGKITHWGLSEADEDMICRAHRICPVTAIQNRYSMMARWHTKLFPILEELNIGFVAFSPLANGFLSARYNKDSVFEAGTDYRSVMPQFTEEGMKKNGTLLALLHQIAEEKQATPAQISLAWMMTKRPYIVPIPGTRRTDRLYENAGAAEVVLQPEEMASIDGALNHMEMSEVFGGSRISQKN